MGTPTEGRDLLRTWLSSITDKKGGGSIIFRGKPQDRGAVTEPQSIASGTRVAEQPLGAIRQVHDLDRVFALVGREVPSGRSVQCQRPIRIGERRPSPRGAQHRLGGELAGGGIGGCVYAEDAREQEGDGRERRPRNCHHLESTFLEQLNGKDRRTEEQYYLGR